MCGVKRERRTSGCAKGGVCKALACAVVTACCLDAGGGGGGGGAQGGYVSPYASALGSEDDEGDSDDDAPLSAAEQAEVAALLAEARARLPVRRPGRPEGFRVGTAVHGGALTGGPRMGMGALSFTNVPTAASLRTALWVRCLLWCSAHLHRRSYPASPATAVCGKCLMAALSKGLPSRLCQGVCLRCWPLDRKVAPRWASSARRRVSKLQSLQVPYREDGPPLAYLFDPIPLPPGAKRRAAGAKRPRSDSRARSAVRPGAAQRAPCWVWKRDSLAQGSPLRSTRA